MKKDPTIAQAIEASLENLKKAMLAMAEVSKLDDEIKIKKDKCLYDLRIARDEVRNINFYK